MANEGKEMKTLRKNQKEILAIETEMQTEKRMKKMRQYPRTKGQLQKVYHMHNGNIRKRRKRAADKSLK